MTTVSVKFYVDLYKDDAGEWRWSIESRNGNIMAVSSEGYKRKAGAIKCFERVKKAFQDGATFGPSHKKRDKK